MISLTEREAQKKQIQGLVHTGAGGGPSANSHFDAYPISSTGALQKTTGFRFRGIGGTPSTSIASEIHEGGIACWYNAYVSSVPVQLLTIYGRGCEKGAPALTWIYHGD